MKTYVQTHRRRTAHGHTIVSRHERTISGRSSSNVTVNPPITDRQYTKYTTLKNESVVEKSGNWVIGTYDNSNTGRKGLFVMNDKTGYIDYPIKYSDGRVAYDNPYRIPESIRETIERG